MKITILYNFIDGPYGGSNQFLKALRTEFIRRGRYIETAWHADVVLYNSFFTTAMEFYDILFKIKMYNPKVIFIHRLDGSLHINRALESHRIYDQAVTDWVNLVADGIVFQNIFCMQHQYAEGIPKYIPSTVIGNAPDPSIFYPSDSYSSSSPQNLVYTSWSTNMRKGFSTLRYLDEYIDFSRYVMTFIGNLPTGYTFRNIQVVPAQYGTALGDILRRQHIFVGLSHNEPCSNAILEAMHCGLPVLIRNSGGNAEFVPYGGVELYERDEDIPVALDVMCANYAVLRNTLSPQNINNIADRYIDFAEQLIAMPYRKHISVAKYLSFRRGFREIMPFRSIKFIFDHIRSRYMTELLHI